MYVGRVPIYTTRRRGTWLSLVVETHLSYRQTGTYLANQRREQAGNFMCVETVQNVLEDHLCQEQLLTGVDFTRYSTLMMMRMIVGGMMIMMMMMMVCVGKERKGLRQGR